MPVILYVALGGALGAVARYGISGWVHTVAGTLLPWGTLFVNVAGSFLLGFSIRYLEFTTVTPELRAALTVGFLGAFTTFSTYSYETVALLQEGAWARAATYALGSLITGILFVLAGFAVAQLLSPARGP
ncbi:MAG: fluoride efflux transporter CrcB [Gemmatimonadota bacterium]